MTDYADLRSQDAARTLRGLSNVLNDWEAPYDDCQAAVDEGIALLSALTECAANSIEGSLSDAEKDAFRRQMEAELKRWWNWSAPRLFGAGPEWTWPNSAEQENASPQKQGFVPSQTTMKV